jgi:hypothetical protein
MALEDTGAAPAAAEQVSAPVVETPAPSAPVEKPSIEDTLASVYDKLNPTRAPDGKFKGNATAAEAAPSEAAPAQENTDQPLKEASEPAAPAIEAPNSWSAEEKGLWAKVPPEAQTIVARREAEAHRTISQQGQQIAAFRPVSEVLERHQASFQRNGVHPAQGIQYLLAASDALDENPVAAIQGLARHYGVDLAKLATGEPVDSDPRIAQLESHVRALTGHLTAREQSEQEAQKRTLVQVIENFAQSKERPHYAELEADILTLIPGIRDANPGLAPERILAEAYEKAQWANPTVRQRILADQQKADEEKRKAKEAEKVKEAKKHQALNQRPGHGSSPVKGSIEDSIREVADRLMPG